MQDRNEKHLPTLATNSSRTWTQRWQERLTPQEAMTGVIRMMSAYSEFSPCSPEYMMTLAQTLCQFPMEVATAACSPIHGVPKEQKNFRPNSGQVSEWCNREAAFLYRMAKREGLLPADSHKTYTGIFKSLNSPYNSKETATSFVHNKESVSPKLQYTTEQRCAHVERLRAEGRLTFETREEADRRKPRFDRLTRREAEKLLADYKHAARPIEAPELAEVPF